MISRRRAGARVAALPLVAAVAFGLAGCSQSAGRGASAGATAEAQVLEAQAAAAHEFGLLSGGGWAQAWSLWAAASRRSVSQAMYTQVNAACPPSLGVPYVIESTAPDGPGRMQVTWQHGDATGTNLLVYEDGAWKFVPSQADLAQYALGAARAVAQRKAAGACR